MGKWMIEFPGRCVNRGEKISSVNSIRVVKLLIFVNILRAFNSRQWRHHEIPFSLSLTWAYLTSSIYLGCINTREFHLRLLFIGECCREECLLLIKVPVVTFSLNLRFQFLFGKLPGGFYIFFALMSLQ